QGEMNKKFEHDIQLVESREDSAEALEPAKQPFYFIALLVQLPVVLPRSQPIDFRWYHRLHTQIKHQLTRFIALVGFVHNDLGAIPAAILERFQKLSSFRRIASLARRQRKRYGSMGACRD